MKDWLGQDYGPGDLVVYAALSGRSANLVLAEVVEILKVFYNEDYKWQQISPDEEVPMHTLWRHGEQVEEPRDTQLRVKVLPIKAARWEQHGRNVYTDTRTGEEIEYPNSEPQWRDESGHFRDFVKVTRVMKPVTLTVTENITKWNGEVNRDD